MVNIFDKFISKNQSVYFSQYIRFSNYFCMKNRIVSRSLPASDVALRRTGFDISAILGFFCPTNKNENLLLRNLYRTKTSVYYHLSLSDMGISIIPNTRCNIFTVKYARIPLLLSSSLIYNHFGLFSEYNQPVYATYQTGQKL